MVAWRRTTAPCTLGSLGSHVRGNERVWTASPAMRTMTLIRVLKSPITKWVVGGERAFVHSAAAVSSLLGQTQIAIGLGPFNPAAARGTKTCPEADRQITITTIDYVAAPGVNLLTDSKTPQHATEYSPLRIYLRAVFD